MKANQSKLKTTARSPPFSCGFFRQCTQTVLSPTSSTPPPLPQAPPPPLPPPPPQHRPPPSQPESSSSSSSNTSQSFTQWRFPSPIRLFPTNRTPTLNPKNQNPYPRKWMVHPSQRRSPMPAWRNSSTSRSSNSAPDRMRVASGRSLVPNPHSAVNGCMCPTAVVGGVVACLRDGVARKSASKVLLALCLVEENRRVAVEAGSVSVVVETLADAESAVAERWLAALELLCTTAEGAAEVRAHALAVPMMVQVMGRMEGRGKEHAISVLAVIYGGLEDGLAVAPAEEVARAVMLALQGECSARARRKGAQLLKILQGNGRVEMTDEER